MHMQTTVSSGDHGERRRRISGGANVFGRMIRAVASRFTGQRDTSLVNVKFTDALERELLSRTSQTWIR
jgi:hypothetical protein